MNTKVYKYKYVYDVYSGLGEVTLHATGLRMSCWQQSIRTAVGVQDNGVLAVCTRERTNFLIDHENHAIFKPLEKKMFMGQRLRISLLNLDNFIGSGLTSALV